MRTWGITNMNEKEITKQFLQKKIMVAEQTASNLRAALAALDNGVDIAASAEVPRNGTRFAGQDVSAAIRQYMQEQRSATLDEIREALTSGGIEWGKYPKRQVKLTIVNNPSVYALKGETVTLR
jgi:hypothetical protein